MEFSYIGDIFNFCWRVWQVKFTIGGISFSLLDVAIVSVGVWVGSMLWTGLVEGD